jgi:hypothetical protein
MNVDDMLERIDQRLSSLLCNPQPDNIEVLVQCMGVLVEEVRRLRTIVQADPSEGDPKEG